MADQVIQMKSGSDNAFPVTQPPIDVSSQVTTLVSGADPLLLIIGRIAYMKVWAPRGTPDQTVLARIPSQYKPASTWAVFSGFYFHSEDFGRICTCMLQEQDVQFRCVTSPTGTYGVLFTASWMF